MDYRTNPTPSPNPTSRKCQICGNVERIPFRCNYCNDYFCGDHRNPINHSCPFLKLYNKKNQHHIPYSNGKKSVFQDLFNALPLKTSKSEILHLSVATVLVICVGLSLNNYRYISWQFLAIFTSAFLVHELAHKFLAQYYGSWAEFRTQVSGLIITAISALPIIPFKFIAPGAVMVGLNDKNKFGRVALIGPLTNLMMGFTFLFLSFLYGNQNPYLSTGTSFNGWIAMFNLMPFGVLDGQKIFDWNKGIWIITMAISMILFIIAHL